MKDKHHVAESMPDKGEVRPVTVAEPDLVGHNSRALSAIRGVFGPDSAECDQAGGTHTSERKSPARTAKVHSSKPA
jgi:hypothetical protein